MASWAYFPLPGAGIVWRDIAYNGVAYCAVGYDVSSVLVVAYSIDNGTTWTSGTISGSISGQANDDLRIFSVGGKFVCNIGKYSSDNGATWSSASINKLFYFICGVQHSMAKAIVLSYDGLYNRKSSVSTDATTWTNTSFGSGSPSAPFYERVAGMLGEWVAIGSDNIHNTAGKSLDDGATWSDNNLPSDNYNSGIIETNGAYYCIATTPSSGGYVSNSTNGTSWTETTFAGCYRLISDGTDFIGLSAPFLRSPDGASWTTFAEPDSLQMLAGAIASDGAGTIVAVGSGDIAAIYSNAAPSLFWTGFVACKGD